MQAMHYYNRSVASASASSGVPGIGFGMPAAGGGVYSRPATPAFHPGYAISPDAAVSTATYHQQQQQHHHQYHQHHPQTHHHHYDGQSAFHGEVTGLATASPCPSPAPNHPVHRSSIAATGLDFERERRLAATPSLLAAGQPPSFGADHQHQYHQQQQQQHLSNPEAAKIGGMTSAYSAGVYRTSMAGLNQYGDASGTATAFGHDDQQQRHQQQQQRMLQQQQQQHSAHPYAGGNSNGHGHHGSVDGSRSGMMNVNQQQHHQQHHYQQHQQNSHHSQHTQSPQQQMQMYANQNSANTFYGPNVLQQPQQQQQSSYLQTQPHHQHQQHNAHQYSHHHHQQQQPHHQQRALQPQQHPLNHHQPQQHQAHQQVSMPIAPLATSGSNTVSRIDANGSAAGAGGVGCETASNKDIAGGGRIFAEFPTDEAHANPTYSQPPPPPPNDHHFHQQQQQPQPQPQPQPQSHHTTAPPNQPNIFSARSLDGDDCRATPANRPPPSPAASSPPPPRTRPSPIAAVTSGTKPPAAVAAAASSAPQSNASQEFYGAVDASFSSAAQSTLPTLPPPLPPPPPPLLDVPSAVPPSAVIDGTAATEAAEMAVRGRRGENHPAIRDGPTDSSGGGADSTNASHMPAIADGEMKSVPALSVPGVPQALATIPSIMSPRERAEAGGGGGEDDDNVAGGDVGGGGDVGRSARARESGGDGGWGSGSASAVVAADCAATDDATAAKVGSIAAVRSADDIAEVPPSNYPTPPPSTVPPYHQQSQQHHLHNQHQHHPQQQHHHQHQQQQQQQQQHHATDHPYRDACNEAKYRRTPNREKNLSRMAAMNRKLEKDTFYGATSPSYEMDRGYNQHSYRHFPARHSPYMMMEATNHMHPSSPYFQQHQQQLHYQHQHQQQHHLQHQQHQHHPYAYARYSAAQNYPAHYAIRSQLPLQSIPAWAQGGHIRSSGDWGGGGHLGHHFGGAGSGGAMPAGHPYAAYRRNQMMLPAGRQSSPVAEAAPRRTMYSRPGRPSAREVLTRQYTGVFESDVIPNKKKRKPKAEVEKEQSTTVNKLQPEIKSLTPLPGFLQAFGSTEIGRFSEMFFNAPESPVENSAFNFEFDLDMCSPQSNLAAMECHEALEASNFCVPSGSSSVHSMNAESYTSTGSPASSMSYFSELRANEY